MVLATLPVLAQQDHRTPTFTRVVTIDGQSYSIKYHLEIQEGSGKIIALNDGYYFETDLPMAQLSPKLIFEANPIKAGITILISKEWNHPYDIFKGPSCKKFVVSNSKYPLFLQPTALVGEMVLNARATLDPEANCTSKATKFQINYRFAGGKVPSEPLPSANDSVTVQQKPDLSKMGPGDKLPDPKEVPGAEDPAANAITPAQANPIATNETGVAPVTNNRSAAKEETPPSKSKEEEAYDKVIKANTLAAFEDFVALSPDNKYRRKIARKIAERRPISIAAILIEPERYQVELQDVIAPQINNISDTLIHAHVVGADLSNYTATVIVEVPVGFERNVNISVFDPKKDSFRYTTIYLGDHLIPKIIYNHDSSAIVRVEFIKGEPPYQVLFKQRGRHIKKEVGILDSIWVPDPTFFSNMEGLFSIEITDNRQSTPLANPDWQVRIEPKNPYLPYYLGGFALVLVLLLVVYPAFRAVHKRKKQARFTSERLQKWEQHLQRIKADQTQLLEAQQTEVVEGGNSFVEVPAAESKLAASAGIRIKKVTKANDKTRVQHNWQELEKILRTSFTLSFPVQQFWADTAVQDIFFTREALEQLDQFLHQENLRQLQEQDGQIPEIGGLLMGRPFQAENPDAYQVLVETFVPISPEYHDRYQLEFSAQSLARDLGDAQDQFPQLSLVGWFHTHPGHGLFLSKPDLRIQDTFFKKPYQFAMEIDSLTERLDTGFFTRMQNGKVNNRRNVPANKSWYSWIEAEDLAR